MSVNMIGVTDNDQEDEHDHSDHLADLPPEVCERICKLLPSLSLYSLCTISSKLCLLARREMTTRHSLLKEKVWISQSSTLLTLHQTIGRLCPGLVLLYSPTTSPHPPHHTHTSFLRLIKPIFTSTSSQTCQALCVPHFSATPSISLSTTAIPPPKCYQLLSLPLCNPTSSALMFFIPVDHPNMQKVRNISGWNICLPHRGALSSLLPPGQYSRICLPGDHQQALLTLAKDILGKEPEISLMMEPIMDPLNMYKDPNTLVLVLTDSNSDPGIQLVLETFFAKVFLPMKVSWIKMVFTEIKKEG